MGKGTIKDLLDQLNEQQKIAVQHLEGPAVVFAGAGSGKTRVITSRLVYLIEKGVFPSQILAVTFTNKAAREMRTRVEKMIPEARGAFISTFHSACSRWLREFAGELGYTSDYVIFDEVDSLSLLKTVYKELNIGQNNEVTPAVFLSLINKAKTRAILPSDLKTGAGADLGFPAWGEGVYERYQTNLAKCNAMDFGDLLLNILLLLRKNRHVESVLTSRYKYVMVDEYQDTNPIQLDLISCLVKKSNNLFVVGDDDQSIYSWRGATSANILRFAKNYPGAKIILLETNYRCSGNIVAAADAVIHNNLKREEKRLVSANETGELIDYRMEVDAEMEAWTVASQIGQERKYQYSEVAVFYRTNSQSRLIEEALVREGIPYKIYGSLRFYERLEVKDLMAYLRLMINEDDDVALRRIYNVPPRKLGEKTLALLEKEAIQRNISLFKTIKALVAENHPKLGAKHRSLYELLTSLKKKISSSHLENIMNILLEDTDYCEYIAGKFPDQKQDKIQNIHEIGAAIAGYASRFPEAGLTDWLQSVTLETSEDEESLGTVSLMTLHMAKGLEFKRVYVVGMEEGLLPHQNCLDDPDDIEEERRLFYVGMTRAKEKLSLISAMRRRLYGTNWFANRPSRFLKEIPVKFLKADNESQDLITQFSPQTGQYVKYEAADYQKKTVHDGSTTYEYSEPVSFKLGTAVHHPTYGKGTIEEITIEFGQIKVLVDFLEHGKRKVFGNHLSSPVNILGTHH